LKDLEVKITCKDDLKDIIGEFVNRDASFVCAKVLNDTVIKISNFDFSSARKLASL
jgi:hypothetical protein